MDQPASAQSEGGSGWCPSGPQRVLVVTIITNTLFTASQFVGAVLADSLALYGDSFDMAIDTATYVFNLWVERRRQSGSDPQHTAKLEIIASLISALALIGASVYLFYDAAGRLSDGEDTDEEPVYVLIFSGLNLVIDIVQIVLFAREFLKHRELKARGASELNVNLASAAAHVGADTTRTLSELVSAFLGEMHGIDPVRADAWGSFVVNGVVLITGIALLVTVFRKWRSLRDGAAVAAVYHELYAADFPIETARPLPKADEAVFELK